MQFPLQTFISILNQIKEMALKIFTLYLNKSLKMCFGDQIRLGSDPFPGKYLKWG